MAKFDYPVHMTRDDNGTMIIDLVDVPELHTFGDGEDEALMWAEDALEEAMFGRMSRNEPIPPPSPARGRRVVSLPPLTAARVALYLTVRDRKLSRAQLARRLGWDIARVARLFDGRYRLRVEDLDSALRVVGKRLVVDLADADAA